MATREEIAQQALALSPEDRTYLADILEQSLTTGEFATPEIAAAWSAEIDRRIAAYTRGESQADDVEVVMKRLHARLDERRRRRETP